MPALEQKWRWLCVECGTEGGIWTRNLSDVRMQGQLVQ